MAKIIELERVTVESLAADSVWIKCRHQGVGYGLRFQDGKPTEYLIKDTTPDVPRYHPNGSYNRGKKDTSTCDANAKTNRPLVEAIAAYVREHGLLETARREYDAQEQFEAARRRVLSSIGRRRQMAETLYRALYDLVAIRNGSKTPADMTAAFNEAERALDASDAGPRVDVQSFRAEDFALACEGGTVEVRGDSGEWHKVPAVAYYGPRKYQGKQFFTTIVATLPCGKRIRHYVDTAIEEMLPPYEVPADTSETVEA